MANGLPDFRFQNQLNVAGIASLLANKAVKEEQIKASQNQRRNENLNTLMSAVTLGSNLASSALSRSIARQAEISKAGLADALANLTSTRQRANDTFLQSPIQQFNTQGQPTQEISPSFGQTNAEDNAMLEAQRAAALVSPGTAAQTVLNPARGPDPLEQQIQLANLAKIQAQTARAQRPEKVAEGDKLLSEISTKKVLKDAGFTRKEIRSGFTKDGRPLPKRLKKRDADALKGKAGFSFNFGSASPPPEELGLGGKAPSGNSVAEKFGF